MIIQSRQAGPVRKKNSKSYKNNLVNMRAFKNATIASTKLCPQKLKASFKIELQTSKLRKNKRPKLIP